MKELKSVRRLASEIEDERFLALFSAFVKTLDSKDYKIMIELVILRYLVAKCEDIHCEYCLNFVYRTIYRTLKKDYLYWERKLLEENIR